MKILSKPLVTILIIVSCIMPSIAQKITMSHFISAKEYLKKNELSKALIELDSATSISSDFGDAYELKGNIWELKKEDRKAISQYSLAILHDPLLTNSYLRRAALHFKLKDHRDYTLNDVNEAIRINPMNASLHQLKAYYYAHSLSSESLKPDYKNAITSLNTAISLDPKEPSYLKLRSDYKFKNGQTLSALLDINSAIAKKNTDDTYFHSRAIIRFTMSDFKSSLNDINKAIELNTLNYLYYQFRGNVYYNLNLYNQAYEDYSTTINLIFDKITKIKSQIEPDNPLNINLRETLLLRGMSLVQENKPYDGCEDFKRSLQMGESKATNYMRQYCR